MARLDSAQRKHILHAAVAVFAAKGLKGTTIRMVGQQAGVNSALMYYYFENKQTLFLEAIRMVLREFLGHLRARHRSFRNARARIHYLVSALFDYYSEHPDRMRLMTLVLSHHPDLFGQVLGIFLKTERLVPLEVLREGIHARQLRPVSPMQTWWSIMGMCLLSLHMHEVIVHIDRRDMPFAVPDMAERERSIVDLLVQGLAAPEQAGIEPERSKPPARRR
jgi:TetR/AcrR family transcriptional regulator